MCSTPRPKRRIKVIKGIKSAGALANMTTNARQRFANKANLADEKRQKLIIAKKTRQQSHILSAKKNKQSTTALKAADKSWFYWLAHASLTQLIRKLLGQHNRQVN